MCHRALSFIPRPGRASTKISGGMSANVSSAAPRRLILLSALAVAGCGDGVICDSSPLVVIQAPTSAVAVDADATAAGVQTDVRVRSSLLPGDEIELIVLDGAGVEAARARLPLDDDGQAVFAAVTVPGPRATLRAIGRSRCGSAEDQVDLDVSVSTGCELQLSPAPQRVAAYPVGVLNGVMDPDPAPGFQA